MELILLSGNSKMTEGWINEVAAGLKPLFSKTHVYVYRHWKTGGDMIDFDHEIDALADHLKGKTDYAIFAKSAGAALAARAVTEGRISPSRCMFAGVPVNWCRKQGVPIEKWFKGLKTRSCIIQKTNDPAIGAKDLKRFLDENGVKNYDLVEIPGEDHHYENVAQIKDLMADLLK